MVAFVQWRRHPSRASAWLAATFGVLALVVVAGQFLPESSDEPIVIWVQKALIAALVLFPYCLYRFMTSLIRPIPWEKLTANVLTSITALGALVLPGFPAAGEPRPAWFQVYITVLLVQWVFLSGLVAVRLWRAALGQPTVARRRMRTMSLGAVGLALALVIGGEFSDGGATAVIVQLLALAAAPLMLIGFAPPYVLRVIWRRQEEAAANEAALSLIGATTTSDVARTLLPHARKLVGATAALLENGEGEIIASDGLDEAEARAAIESLGGDHPTPEAHSNGSLLRIPMRSGRLTVVASPFTAFFGRDEIASLEGLATLADLALARTRLLDSQRRLAEIVESSEDAILTKTLDGIITSWNRGAERIYGYRPEEVLGKSISMLVLPEREDEMPKILQRVRSNESIEHYETKRLTKDGRTIEVSLSISPVRDAEGRVTGASTIARDVTEQREAEREREAAREEAHRANRAKSDFLGRMSHELRTPLNAVLGFAQLLDMDPLTPEQKEGTAEIMKAGKHLLELIDEVLDISRIEAGRLRLSLEPVDALQVVEECISLLTPLAAQEGVGLSLERQSIVDRSAFVIADRQRLKQVLLNLISNGIKYNRQHGSVRASIEPTGQDRLRLDVTDTGHGIPTERIDQLFTPFERLGADTSSIEGTGLGLALSKSLVELMGGTITAESEPGQGSTFSVELASVEDPSKAAGDGRVSGEEAVAPPRPAASRTVLYIEDNLSNLKLVERLVARRPGLTLSSAMQGSIGLTLARDHRPDLIFLDLNLPDIAGDEVLARLQADPRTAELPVVVISADATPGQLERLLAAGARAYLTKPIDVGRFFQVLDEFCGEP